MLRRFLEFVEKEKLFEPRERILLAVSGGMDSAVMAWLFHKAGFYFGIAHCNFGLRELESDGDEYFVKEMAAKYDVPYYCRHFDTLQYAGSKGISVQMAARELRYAFFNEILKARDYKYIASAHHRDDEIETYFINLIRGTGIAGLSGYHAVESNIIRPMLFACRTEIEEFAVSNNIKFREDSSNRSDKYIRNKIRNQLIPLLREINPNVGNTLRNDIERLANVEMIFDRVIAEAAKTVISEPNGEVRISIAKVAALEPAEAYLFGFLHPYGFSGDIIHNILKALHGQAGKIFMSATHRLVKDRDYLIITPLEKEKDENIYLVGQYAGEVSEPLSIRFCLISMEDLGNIPEERHIACFDADKLHFPLKIRRWQQGDHFSPFGMRGKKKLSDFFTDKKFSLEDKENAWLLCSGDDIIWIIGHRSDNRYRVTGKTQRIYRAELVL